MNLEQATLAALEAAQAGDLAALAHALGARQAALDQGELAALPGVFSAGEITLDLLRSLTRDMRLEAARLQRIADGFRPEAPSAHHVDFVG